MSLDNEPSARVGLPGEEGPQFSLRPWVNVHLRLLNQKGFKRGSPQQRVHQDVEGLAHPVPNINEVECVSEFHSNLERIALLFALDRKSTRLNSSHLGISYAVFCLKKKKNKT